MPHYILNQGAIVGDEPCLPVGDVALNVSSSKFDDVAANASKVYFSLHIFGTNIASTTQWSITSIISATKDNPTFNISNLTKKNQKK